MGNLINNFFNFFTDKSRPVLTRTSLLLCLVVACFMIDNFVGFSFFYSSHQKLKQVQQIEEIKRDYNLEPQITNEISALELRLLSHSSMIHKAFGFLTKRLNSKTDIKGTSVIKKQTAYSPIPLVLSSSWPFILLLLVVLFSPFSKSRKIDTFSTFIIGLTVCVVLIVFCQFVGGIIPVLFHPWINYTLYAGAWVFLLVIAGNHLNKK